MLQQTRVAAVLPYYERFLARFPDVTTLARTRESAVLAAWSGLGYYRRARHLHAAAKQISQRGSFPRTAAELRNLPGIGRYTASAIASMAFGERCAVVDGNVERVLARIGGAPVPRTEGWKIAEVLLSRLRPGDFNQAIMELGALVCTPKAPQCASCPVAKLCRTRGEHATPVGPRRKRRELRFILTTRPYYVLLAQRSSGESLMPGMWELPSAGGSIHKREPVMRLRHSILNTDYAVTVFANDAIQTPEGKWVRTSRAAHLPLTGLARKILRTAGLLA
jgi:A/G-specific adenine glycosylase